MHARSKTGAGFTIVEVMIFLAISGLMFVLAVNAMSGKQQQTEFNTGVNTLKSELNQDLSNVANGNYLSIDKVGCQAGLNTAPQLTPPGPPDGSCTIIGEVIAFTQDTLPSNGQHYYTVYPIFARNYVSGSSSQLAFTLGQAKPIIDTAAQQEVALPFSLKVDPNPFRTAAISSNGGGVGALALVSFTSFAGGNSTPGSTTQLSSGSSHVEVFAIPTTSLSADHDNLTSSDTANKFNGKIIDCSVAPSNLCVTSTANPITLNPPSGVTICFDSGTDNESVYFTIGGINSADNVTEQVYSNNGPINGCK